MVRRKSKLFTHAKKTNQWDAFKEYQRECKKVFKNAEISYISNTIQTGLNEKKHKTIL